MFFSKCLSLKNDRLFGGKGTTLLLCLMTLVCAINSSTEYVIHTINPQEMMASLPSVCPDRRSLEHNDTWNILGIVFPCKLTILVLVNTLIRNRI